MAKNTVAHGEIKASGSKLRRLIAAAAAVLMGVALIPAVAPTAQAAEHNIVLFGDSIWANSTGSFPSKAAELSQGPGKITGNVPLEGRCLRGAARVGASLQRQTGVKVQDFACNGATAFAAANGANNVTRQINQALGQRALNPATQAVFLNIGMLDNFWGLAPLQIQTDNFVNTLRPQIARIKRAAPNAKIAFVGYPTIVDRAGFGCFAHVGALDQAAIAVPPVRMSMDATHHWQRTAARATGIGWIDMEAATRGNGTCAAPSHRYMSGIIDNTSTPYNMATHLTRVGNEGVARVLSRHI